MFKNKFIKVLTVCLQICLLIALFIPITQEYSNKITIWSKIVESFRLANSELILVNSLYYLPNIISIILVVVFSGRIKYLLAAVSSTFGISVLLIQYIFPAVATPYLFYVYNLGLYVILALQFLIIILCILGVSLDNTNESKQVLSNKQAKENTQEILLDGEHE